MRLTPGRRAVLLPLAGAAIALAAANTRLTAPFGATDFDQVRAAARVVLDGGDPYAEIGPDRRIPFPYPFYYPLTAAVLGTPFAAFSLETARVLFVAASGGILGYAIARQRPWLWPLFLGVPFFMTARNGQWAALFTATLLLPGLGPVLAAKPNIGLAILMGSRSVRAALPLVAGGVVVLALSLVADPGWLPRWLETLQGAEHFRPLIARPGGFLMLLALLRYRDPDARLLLGLALVPQTGMSYEALPAILVAQTGAQAMFLALATHAAWYAGVLVHAAEPAAFAVESWNEGQLVLVGCLMVPLALVLWRGRPRRRPKPRTVEDAAEDPAPVA